MGNNQDPVTLHKYLYGNDDSVNMVDPSGLMASPYGSMFGQIVDDYVCEEYRAWAISPKTLCDSIVNYGVFGEYLKPDIFDPLHKRYAEVKPLSISGIGSGIAQIKGYDLAFGFAGFSREIDFSPAPAYIGGSYLYFLNNDGVIFYTDDEGEKNALSGLPLSVMKARYRIYWQSQSLMSASGSSIGVVDKVVLSGVGAVMAAQTGRLLFTAAISGLTARFGF